MCRKRVAMLKAVKNVPHAILMQIKTPIFKGCVIRQ